MVPKYVLITAARNEEAYIARTIEAVLAQTVRPAKWIIVSDGSTDKTDEIVKQYAVQYSFIDFQRRDKDNNKADFASKAFALKHGDLRLQGLQYEFIGILDADITFKPSYYEDILKQFAQNPRLGIAGGFVYQEEKGDYRNRPTNAVHSVAGAIQLFRQKCYEAVGGIQPSKAGGEDWIAEITARMRGWEVQAFPEFVAYHHKSSASARGFVQECLRQGSMHYVVGSHPVFEIVKCIRRIKARPYFLVAVLIMCGYIQAWLKNETRVTTPEARAYLRKEELSRLLRAFV